MENSIEMVIDKIGGLIDLLFSVSAGIESGLVPRNNSLALLAEIAQEVENDLKEVLQVDDSDNCHTDTSLEKWCDELLGIFKRLDWFGRSEVLLYADKVEKKRLNEE
ncbi:MAG: hypothetical protein HDT43_04875 [Ruminococcaceae bacterium]|nr:hypothetical protein [Oscillospiraceae bacterium]